jgi:hypothetical protein
MEEKLRRGAALAVLFIFMVLASRQAGLALRGRPTDAAILLLMALASGALVWWYARREM